MLASSSPERTERVLRMAIALAITSIPVAGRTTRLDAFREPMPARAAWLERELRAHGAPRALIQAAKKFASSSIPNVPRASREVRDLETIAKENAALSCVSETYGAAVATWQGEIAPDELRHAALGWAVDAWISRRLSMDARARVRAARDEATRALLEETRRSPEAHALATAIAGQLWAA